MQSKIHSLFCICIVSTFIRGNEKGIMNHTAQKKKKQIFQTEWKHITICVYVDNYDGEKNYANHINKNEKEGVCFINETVVTWCYASSRLVRA